MQAIVGLDIDGVTEIVESVQGMGVIAVANHNTAEQVVITGSPDAVEAAGQAAKAKGVKAIPLKVSGAWHSELIRGAEEEFTAFLGEVPFNEPLRPVLFNVTAALESDPDEIKELKARQLCSPVRWYDSMCKMQEEEIEVFAEVGPKKVLTGLLRKIIPDTYEHEVYNVDGMKGLEAFLKAVT